MKFGFLSLYNRLKCNKIYLCSGIAFTALTVGKLASPGVLTYSNIIQIASLLLLCILMPRYAKLLSSVEDRVNFRFALITTGRIVRVLLHLPIVYLMCLLLIGPNMHIEASVLIMTAFASIQTTNFAIRLAYRGFGDRIGNTVLSFALFSTLILLIKLDGESFTTFLLLTIFSFTFLYDTTLSLASDLRSFLYPRSGIGVFFGTFNPVHRTHVAILRRVLDERKLQKIYLHPTTIPKLHRLALQNGEIEFRHENGMRVYQRTAAADSNKNYFPTGNRFFEYEVRNELLKASIYDEGLENKVEVLELPEVYERFGFHGVLKCVKQRHPECHIHGLHGSDPGGMWVRNIFDDSGWIYPFPVIRKDAVSATAIRNGGAGMTTPTVECFLSAVRSGVGFVFPSGYIFAASTSQLPESSPAILPDHMASNIRRPPLPV